MIWQVGAEIRWLPASAETFGICFQKDAYSKGFLSHLFITASLESMLFEFLLSISNGKSILLDLVLEQNLMFVCLGIVDGEFVIEYCSAVEGND